MTSARALPSGPGPPLRCRRAGPRRGGGRGRSAGASPWARRCRGRPWNGGGPCRVAVRGDGRTKPAGGYGVPWQREPVRRARSPAGAGDTLGKQGERRGCPVRARRLRLSTGRLGCGWASPRASTPSRPLTTGSGQGLGADIGARRRDFILR